MGTQSQQWHHCKHGCGAVLPPSHQGTACDQCADRERRLADYQPPKWPR